LGTARTRHTPPRAPLLALVAIYPPRAATSDVDRRRRHQQALRVWAYGLSVLILVLLPLHSALLACVLLLLCASVGGARLPTAALVERIRGC
jgi:hypothetical protein